LTGKQAINVERVTTNQNICNMRALAQTSFNFYIYSFFHFSAALFWNLKNDDVSGRNTNANPMKIPKHMDVNYTGIAIILLTMITVNNYQVLPTLAISHSVPKIQQCNCWERMSTLVQRHKHKIVVIEMVFICVVIT
jgi:hypothetical protein